jgi:hypothetical protein
MISLIMLSLSYDRAGLSDVWHREAIPNVIEHAALIGGHFGSFFSKKNRKSVFLQKEAKTFIRSARPPDIAPI